MKDKLLGLGHLLDIFQVDEAALLVIVRLPCAIWAGINALFLRGIWVDIAEMLVGFIPAGVNLPVDLLALLKLLAWLGLLFIVVDQNAVKWLKAVVASVIVKVLLKLIINGVTALINGTAWSIPGLGGAFFLVFSVLAQNAVRSIAIKKKKDKGDKDGKGDKDEE